MDKERLRRIFGKFGDGILDDLQGFAEERGLEVAEVGSLVGRAVESAPDITCRENQTILLGHLKGYINGNVDTSFEEIYSTMRHRKSCTSSKCRKIGNIASFDKRLTPEAMKSSFGEEIENWEIE